MGLLPNEKLRPFFCSSRTARHECDLSAHSEHLKNKHSNHSSKMSFVKNILMVVLVTGMLAPANGQSARAFMTKGKQAYNAGNYSSALAYFQVIIEEVGADSEVLFYAGESARQIRSYVLAEEYLSAIPRTDWREEYALTGYYLGLVKKSQEKFEEAIDLFEQFAAERADLSKYRSKAIIEIQNCEWAMEMMKRPANVEVKQLNEAVNTVYSDYSPVMAGDTLYYTSTDRVKVDLRKSANTKKKKKKRRKPKKKPKLGQYEEVLVTKMFWSIDGMTGEPLRQNSRSTSAFTANLAFNSTNSRMYYTICNQLNLEDNIFRCKLYFRDKTSSGSWGRAQELPDHINAGGTSSTQPTIGLDPETGEEILYFVSDREGGRGKQDIWISRIDKRGYFSQPVNLADVNTPEDELTPFFDTESQTLYFSSDGFQNFGGYDVFSVKKTEDGWTKPENLGYPINSSYDDISYYLEKKTGRAFIASNRKGAFCISPDKDCSLHDIYELTASAEVLVSAFDAKDYTTLFGTTIVLENLTTKTSETFEMTVEEGELNLPIHPQHSYRITFTKDGYETGVEEISPDDIQPAGDEPTKRFVFLKPWTQLVVRTVDVMNNQPVYGMSIRLVDKKTGEAEVFHLSTSESEYRIKVKADREYEVVALKAGFDPVVEKVRIPADAAGSVITQDIFLNPFFGGLPLNVYFDNNAPSASAGSMTYGETYDEYIFKKKEFITEYAAGLEGMSGEVAKMEATRFFETEIQSGYYDLLRVTENLLFALRDGERIVLTLEGYSSPLADNEYNRQLAERRIQTIVNHFENYKNGALKEFIGDELEIKKIPYGENPNAAGVSDRADDRRSSVYSPKASLERRVIIGGYRVISDGSTSSLK